MKITCSSLAALAMLAVSSATAALTPRQNNKPKTQVSPALYEQLLYYGRYAPTYPKAPCQIPPSNTAVQGFANADPATEMTLFRSDTDRELVMAFPGTAGLQDLLTDIGAVMVPYNSPGIDCPDCKVHAAVLRAWNNMAPLAKAELDKAVAQYPDYKFVIVGHSLGGAIAQFAFNGFASQGYQIRAAYTYGQFRVGNAAFANLADRLSGSTDKITGNYYRVTHADDGVPQVLSPASGFRHPRNEYWFQAGPGNNSAVSTTFQCYGQEPTDCNNSQFAIGLLGINEAHIKYPGVNVLGCGGFGPIGTELPF